MAPPEIVPAARASDRKAYDRILQVERRLADRANEARDRAEARAARRAERREAERLAALEQERRERDAANRSSWIAAIGALLAGAGLVLLARRRDRVPGLPEVVREPPEAIHPVSLAIRWHAYRRVPGTKQAYRAQLLHLASQGIVELRATGSVSDPDDLTIRLRRRPDDDGPDRDFVTFLFPDDEHDDASVSLSALRTGGTDGVVLRRWWTNALHGVSGVLERIRRGRLRFETVAAGLVGIVVAVRGLVALLADGAEAGAVAIAAGLVTWLGVSRFVPPRLGAHDREGFARWAGFRRYLRDFSNLHEAPTMAVTIWQHYLVWAVALGIADEVEEQVRALVPPEAMPAPWPGGPAGLDALRWGTLASVHVPSFAGSWLALSGGGWGGGSVFAGRRLCGRRRRMVPRRHGGSQLGRRLRRGFLGRWRLRRRRRRRRRWRRRRRRRWHVRRGELMLGTPRRFRSMVRTCASCSARTEQDFHRRGWHELVQSDPAGTFFHTPAFLKLYWEEFGETPDHLLAGLRRGGRWHAGRSGRVRAHR